MIDLKDHIAPAIVSIGVIAPLLFWAMDREPPFVRISGRIEPSVVQAGTTATVVWDIKAKRSCPPASATSVRRKVVTSAGTFIPFEDASAIFGTAPGDEFRKEIRRTIHIPRNSDPGPAKYSAVSCYTCNPVHYFWPICVTSKSLDFTIGAPDAADNKSK